MRKWKILFLSLFILTTGFGVLAVSQPNRTIILLHNGKVIPVDRTWEAGNDLFYENEKEIHFVSRAQIKSIGTLSPAQRLKAAGDRCTDYLGGRIRDVAPLVQDATRLAGRFSDHLAAGAGVGALVLLIASLRWVRGRLQKEQAAAAAAPPPPRAQRKRNPADARSHRRGPVFPQPAPARARGGPGRPVGVLPAASGRRTEPHL